jgi:hypothetical protein
MQRIIFISDTSFKGEERMRVNVISFIMLGLLVVGTASLIAQEKSPLPQQNQQDITKQDIDTEYSYVAIGKKDPFKNPKIDDMPPAYGDMQLQGIATDTKGNYIAIMSTEAKGKSYQLKAGDKLPDGEVLSIDAEKVVLKVPVKEDILKFRTVTLWLHPEKSK